MDEMTDPGRARHLGRLGWLRVVVALRRLARPSRRRLHILSFHDVPEHHLDPLGRLIDELGRTHRVIAPAQAEVFLRGNGREWPRQPLCLLTFDDGYRSHADVDARVLAPRGVKAVFFVCPDLVDLSPADQQSAVRQRLFPRRRVRVPPPSSGFLSWEQLRTLAAAGHTIGSHGATHAELSHVDAGDKTTEIRASAEALTRRLAVPIAWFAYPFGDLEAIDAESLRLIRRHYEWCCSGIRGSNPPGSFLLRRQPISLSWPFQQQLAAALGVLDLRHARARRRADALAPTPGESSTRRND